MERSIASEQSWIEELPALSLPLHRTVTLA